jgi:protein-tyrosine-phosphatase
MAGETTDLTVDSAGVSALVGHSIDPVMAAALGDRGIDTAEHRARQLSAHLLRSADLILTFEAVQRAWVLAQRPAAVRSTFTVRRAALVLADRPRHGEPLGFLAHDRKAYGPDDDFPDPYGHGPEAARRAVEQIEELLRVVLPALGAVDAPTPSPQAGELVS